MKTRLMIVLLLWLVTVPGGVGAQDGMQGWPVVERCVGEAVDLSDIQQTFHGVILMSRLDGLYAVRTDSSNPERVGDLGNSMGRSHATYQLNLSPDRTWYVLVHENITVAEPDEGYYDEVEVDAISVYSTLNPQDVYTIPWHNRFYTRWWSTEIFQARWWDNEHIIYWYGGRNVLLNPFTGEIIAWERGAVPTADASLSYPSPDWTRAIYRIPYTSNWVLYDITRREELRPLGSTPFPVVAWQADSARFVMQVNLENLSSGSYSPTLAFLDRDGNIEDVLFVAPDELQFRYFLQNSTAWTADRRYFAFVLASGSDDEDSVSAVELYIADMHERQIYKTCVTLGLVVGLSWSPDDILLAFRLNRWIHLLDVENWQLYSMPHTGDVLGWRADE